MKNTVHLLFGSVDLAAAIASAPHTPRAITKLDLEGTVKPCSDALDRAAHVQFLPLSGVEEYRQARIAEINDSCAYDTAYIRGFRDASALRPRRVRDLSTHWKAKRICSPPIVRRLPRIAMLGPGNVCSEGLMI